MGNGKVTVKGSNSIGEKKCIIAKRSIGLGSTHLSGHLVIILPIFLAPPLPFIMSESILNAQRASHKAQKTHSNTNK